MTVVIYRSQLASSFSETTAIFLLKIHVLLAAAVAVAALIDLGIQSAMLHIHAKKPNFTRFFYNSCTYIFHMIFRPGFSVPNDVQTHAVKHIDFKKIFQFNAPFNSPFKMIWTWF